MDFDGMCDPFVKLSYCDEEYSTHHAEKTLDADFGETFNFFIHGAERALAISHASEDNFNIAGALLLLWRLLLLLLLPTAAAAAAAAAAADCCCCCS